jgi:hypothetical protein
MNREARIISIADELGVLDEVGEVSKMCFTLGATDEEQIREVIGTVFTKGEIGSGTLFEPDSGKTKGSKTFFTRTQIKDRAFWTANKDAILEAEKEGRVRDE